MRDSRARTDHGRKSSLWWRGCTGEEFTGENGVTVKGVYRWRWCTRGSGVQVRSVYSWRGVQVRNLLPKRVYRRGGGEQVRAQMDGVYM